MKILDRYLISNILKIAFFTILIFALLLAAVELFSKMDQIMNGDIPFTSLVSYIALSIPEYLLMVASLALLFATTYFLSTLSANNERIALLNAGISKSRLAFPIIILSIVITLLGFCYQEFFLNKIIAKHDDLEVTLFGMSSTHDSRNIVLKDDNGYIVYTNRFSESNNRIYDPIIVHYEEDELKLRLEAEYGVYDGEWVFHNARVYLIDEFSVASSFYEEYRLDDFKIEPNLFRSQNTSIETMDSKAARDYLKRLKVVDQIAWQEKATDYYSSLFQPLAIFVLMFVSAMMNYSFKKNVLLFSIIQSLSIAVVYYCADMVFSIASHQGAISPYAAVALPLLVTIGVAYIISLLGRRL